MQLAVLWGATLALLAAGTRWRVPRGTLRLRGLLLVLWLTPAVVAAFIGAARQWPLPGARAAALDGRLRARRADRVAHLERLSPGHGGGADLSRSSSRS